MLWELASLPAGIALNLGITRQLVYSWRKRDTRSFNKTYITLQTFGLWTLTAYLFHLQDWIVAFYTIWGALAWTLIAYLKWNHSRNAVTKS